VLQWVNLYLLVSPYYSLETSFSAKKLLDVTTQKTKTSLPRNYLTL
jgi:hypothetical protein